MRCPSTWLAAGLLVPLLIGSSCTHTKMTAIKDPDAREEPYKRLLVVAAFSDLESSGVRSKGLSVHSQGRPPNSCGTRNSWCLGRLSRCSPDSTRENPVAVRASTFTRDAQEIAATVDGRILDYGTSAPAMRRVPAGRRAPLLGTREPERATGGLRPEAPREIAKARSCRPRLSEPVPDAAPASGHPSLLSKARRCRSRTRRRRRPP